MSIPSTTPPPATEGDELSLAELRALIVERRLWRECCRRREVVLRVPALAATPRPLATAVALRILARRAAIIDDAGNRCDIGVTEVGRRLGRCALNLLRRGVLVRAIKDEVEKTISTLAARSASPRLRGERVPLYLRTDDWYGVKSGGSVGHVAGVVNHLGNFAAPPRVFSTDHLPSLRSDIELQLLPTSAAFRDFADAPLLEGNRLFAADAALQAAAAEAAFIYQRYSRYNFTGLALAVAHRVPFVLEYNGSEVWIAAKWGQSLRYPKLAEQIELLNLRGADLVVVVSDVMREELVGRGIDGDKILVNPNGVDPDVYSPAIDGGAVRRRWGLEGKTAIGFIGTFGAWHGAEVLAEAFGKLVADNPSLRESLRLLLIGDGMKMPEVKARIAEANIGELCVLAGRVPQEDGPKYLAACDILASPHVPNADGTRFFGSPTKLFEYMAMGKPIIASNLEQIGQVLRHRETAWLTEPGDAAALASGLQSMLQQPELCTAMGAAARRQATLQHSWKEHTRRIVAALQERCP